MKMVRNWMPVVLLAGLLVSGALLYRPIIESVAYAVQKGQNQADREQLAELSQREQLSAIFRAVARVMRPAVVEVRVTKRMEVDAPDLDEYFRRFFGDEDLPSPFNRGGRGAEPRKREYFSKGLGSGVIVDAANGYILTNYHVIVGATDVAVVMHDNRQLKTQWVRGDAMTDLAVVKVEPDKLVGAPLGDSDKIEVGDWVLAIGAPEGLAQTVTAGIISAKGRTTGDPTKFQDFLQTDAAINHGNSGGPLVNLKGEVIGINAAIVSRTGVNEGIGLAIPSNMVRQIMAQLVEKGKVTRGYIGVRIKDVDEGLARDMKLPNAGGTLVLEVSGDSPAAKASLRVEDFIVSVDGKPVADTKSFRNTVAAIPPGTTVEFGIIRDGKPVSVKITIAALPADGAEEISQTTPAKGNRYGLEVATLTANLAKANGFRRGTTGVIITSVDGGSDAAGQGLEEGMVITHVGGMPAADAEQFNKAITAPEFKDGVRLRVITGDGPADIVFVTPQK